MPLVLAHGHGIETCHRPELPAKGQRDDFRHQSYMPHSRDCRQRAIELTSLTAVMAPYRILRPFAGVRGHNAAFYVGIHQTQPGDGARLMGALKGITAGAAVWKISKRARR